MYKTIVGMGVGFAALALPLVSFAATNVTFLNFPAFGANATVAVGDSLDAKATYTLTGGSNLESLDWEMVGSGIAPTCVDVADRISDGTFNVTFPMDTTGGTEGTWAVRIRTYGVPGAGTDNNCGGAVQTTSTFGNRLTLTESANANNPVANNTGSGSSTSHGTGDVAAPSWVSAFMAQLTALLHPATPPTPPTPPVATACTQLASYLSPASQNTRSDANIALQGYLLSQHMSIPALAAGASFGFYGPQTASAVYTFQMQNSCH